MDPVEAMRQGKAHRVPLIVGTNAEEARLFTRFLPLLPMNEPMIEAGYWPTPTPRPANASPPPTPTIRAGGLHPARR